VIPYRTRFGPYEGKKVSSNDDTGYGWLVGLLASVFKLAEMPCASLGISEKINENRGGGCLVNESRNFCFKLEKDYVLCYFYKFRLAQNLLLSKM